MINFVSINFIYIRKVNFLSQPEFADIFKITRDIVSSIENKKNKLFDLELLQKVGNHFDVNLDDLINKDLSKLKKTEGYVNDIQEPYHILDKKTEAMYERIIKNYEEQLLLKNKLLDEKDKTANAHIKTIEALQKEVIMLEVIINQNAINTDAPLTDKIFGILKLENEIDKAKEKLKNKQQS